ncbi:uncharacterized protein BDCG_04498 [Blastomyces dermatitidis ER-3]|uniref:Integral membrane protein n=3 Tax=Blastomyces TaxID=229219 RepID=A0A179UCK4_BLAGS|nr:uncharacterized protein BDBG_01476 [Blastomyces gilchristii SLH14081]XP_031576490.1 integral membrane protein, variant 1 [Blastomyces gilchristii SLH14081]XP_031576491.1 integral membrane protein, variant 2 [Blastomyces gilchristii SLH14081]XP_045276316.1 uncharacterized protein BDCG_04498 [Blastomyces dermatitidis ER-3]EGE85922.1 integral membrane protein [Blastomyces dermatitidis ATCC 18188]EQL30924.1 hypothetical protein BDFG_06681 [Blastomyces dermatitidis ATCC 26199]EEQ89378.2 integra
MASMAAATEPALAPPLGIESNFDGQEEALHVWNLVTQGLCISLTSIFFFLRMYVRVYVNRGFGREDWCCSLAWFLGVGYSIIAILMGKYGGGYHQWDVPKSDIVPFNKTVYGTMVIYGPAAFLTKASILLILTRVFAPYRKTVRFIYVYFGVLLAYYVPAIIVKVRICMPISYFWMGQDSEGSCLDERAIILADAIISVVSDLTILVLPLLLTHSLQMSLKKKIRVIGILGAGGLACASSIVRLVLIVQKGNAKDQTYVFMQINLWGNAEVSIGIICACLPSLAALLNRISNEYMSRNGSRSYDCELAGTDTLTGSKIAGSQGSFNDAGSEQEILASHAQSDMKVETAIRADEPGTMHSHHRALHSFTGRGIMKTVDVSHTITTKE